MKLVINTARPVAKVARERVKEQTLGRWVLPYKARQEVGGKWGGQQVPLILYKR